MKGLKELWWRVLPFVFTAALSIYLMITGARWHWYVATIIGVLAGTIVDYIFSKWLESRPNNITRRERIRRSFRSRPKETPSPN